VCNRTDRVSFSWGPRRKPRTSAITGRDVHSVTTIARTDNYLRPAQIRSRSTNPVNSLGRNVPVYAKEREDRWAGRKYLSIRAIVVDGKWTSPPTVSHSFAVSTRIPGERELLSRHVTRVPTAASDRGTILREGESYQGAETIAQRNRCREAARSCVTCLVFEVTLEYTAIQPLRPHMPDRVH